MIKLSWAKEAPWSDFQITDTRSVNLRVLTNDLSPQGEELCAFLAHSRTQRKIYEGGGEDLFLGVTEPWASFPSSVRPPVCTLGSPGSSQIQRTATNILISLHSPLERGFPPQPWAHISTRLKAGQSPISSTLHPSTVGFTGVGRKAGHRIGVWGSEVRSCGELSKH